MKKRWQPLRFTKPSPSPQYRNHLKVESFEKIRKSLMYTDDYRSTLLVMLGYAAAMLTGFLRQAVIAYQMGVDAPRIPT
jgi:hypothetical protein